MLRKEIVAIIVAVLGLPAVCNSQSTLNFPRALALSDLPTTGFALVNLSHTNAPVTFTLYAVSGQPVSTSLQSIPARGQFSKLATELFPSVQTGGWVQATSTTSGLQGFWLGGDFATYMDGAEAATPSQDMIFPLVTAQTEIDLANTGGNAAAVTITLYGLDGSTLTTPPLQPIPPIPALGVFQIQVSALFPSVDLTQAGHIRVTATVPLAGVAVITGFLVSPSWGAVNAVDMAAPLTDLNFPHVVSGQLGSATYGTVVGVTNATSTNQSATLTFTPEAGGTSRSIQQLLPGNGSVRDTIQNLFGLAPGFQDGWVRVTGTASITGYVAYGERSAAAMTAVPAQPFPQTTLVFDHIADLSPWLTGIALLNTTSSTARVEVFAVTPAGVLIGGSDNVFSAEITLPARTKTAKLLSEIIPQTQSRITDGGFIFVRSSVPIYGTEFFFSRDLRVLSNVLAGPGSAYAPPIVSPTLSEEFDGNALDLSKWNIFKAAPVVGSGRLTLPGATTRADIQSERTFSSGFLRISIESTNWNQYTRGTDSTFGFENFIGNCHYGVFLIGNGNAGFVRADPVGSTSTEVNANCTGDSKFQEFLQVPNWDQIRAGGKIFVDLLWSPSEVRLRIWDANYSVVGEVIYRGSAIPQVPLKIRLKADVDETYSIDYVRMF